MSEIWFDSDIYELADRGLAFGKIAVLETFVQHVEMNVPIPEDLLAAAARVIRKEIPKIENDRGVHDKDFIAWENAILVKEMLDADPQLTVDNACHAVSKKIGLSPEAVARHWKKFSSNGEFKRGEIPPLRMLGTIPFGESLKE